MGFPWGSGQFDRAEHRKGLSGIKMRGGWVRRQLQILEHHVL